MRRVATMELPRSVDILIIGAGAIGSFTALNLARLGEQPLVIERKVPGIEASGANAGSLGVQNKPVRLATLSIQAVNLWRDFEFETGLDAGYHRTGGFRVAENEDGVERLRVLAADHSRVGLEVEHIDGDEARRRAPYLSNSVLAANYSPVDGHNNSLRAAPLVARAAQMNGARFALGVEARQIHRAGTGYLVNTSAGPVHCRQLIITAGVWARDFMVVAGVELPVVLRTNQMMVTEPVPEILTHVIFHIDGHLTLKQVHPAMSCLIGGGWPGGGDFRRHQRDTNVDSLIGNAALATRIVPALAKLRVLRSWSGFDWRTRDQMPTIGEVPGWSGVFICTSCFGGYTLSPVLGQGLATAVTSGALPPDLQEFSPAAALAAHGLLER